MSDKISTLVNLISPKIGSHGVYANDEFFAPLERMLSETDPIFIPDKYDNHCLLYTSPSPRDNR